MGGLHFGLRPAPGRRGSRPGRARRDVVEANQIDILPASVLRHFEQIENTEKAGGAGQSRSDVGQADGFDGVNLDLPFFHSIARPDTHVGAHPDAD